VIAATLPSRRPMVRILRVVTMRQHPWLTDEGKCRRSGIKPLTPAMGPRPTPFRSSVQQRSYAAGKVSDQIASPSSSRVIGRNRSRTRYAKTKRPCRAGSWRSSTTLWPYSRQTVQVGWMRSRAGTKTSPNFLQGYPKTGEPYSAHNVVGL
jgi:hypothetical protein